MRHIGKPALNTSTTFGGDVSGKYNATVVGDDSHNHIVGNVDGLQTALNGKQATIADGDLTIAKTSGLQTALDAKATATSPTFTGDTTISTNSADYKPVLDIKNINAGAYAGILKFTSTYGSTAYTPALIRAYGGSGSSDGNLAFETAGTERIRIKGDGKVGIGTFSPQDYSLLHVKGDMGAEPYCAIVSEETNTNTGYGGFLAKGVKQGHYRYMVGGSLKFQTRAGHGSGADKWELYSWTSGSAIVCDGANDANIGINEESPDCKLVVLTANNDALRLKTTGVHGTKPAIYFDSGLSGTNYADKARISGGYDSGTGGSGGFLAFNTKDTGENSQTRLTIDSSGNLETYGPITSTGQFLGRKVITYDDVRDTDPTYYKILLPTTYAEVRNGGHVKITMIWRGTHAAKSATKIIEFSYGTYHSRASDGYLTLSPYTLVHDSVTETSYSSYDITPGFALYRGVVEDSNGDCGAILKVTGRQSSYNLRFHLRVEVTGDTQRPTTITDMGSSLESGAVGISQQDVYSNGNSGIANDVTRIYCSYDGKLRYLGKSDFKVLMGLTGKTTYDRRDSTSDSNYWTGAMSYGSEHMDTTFFKGCGFTDNWGNPTNQPSSESSHWNGVQSLHYSTGSINTTYGWQMLVGAGNPAYSYLRGSWGSTTYGWAKMWNSFNDGSGSGLDADTLDGNHGSHFLNASNLSSGTVPVARMNKVLPTSGNYVWNNSTTAGNYTTGLQCSFVRASDGFPQYGSVLHVGGRGGSDAGGDFQIYCGHGSGNGGNYLRVRNADNNASPSDSWTSWRTIWDSGNTNFDHDWNGTYGATQELKDSQGSVRGFVHIGRTNSIGTSYQDLVSFSLSAHSGVWFEIYTGINDICCNSAAGGYALGCITGSGSYVSGNIKQQYRQGGAGHIFQVSNGSTGKVQIKQNAGNAYGAFYIVRAFGGGFSSYSFPTDN